MALGSRLISFWHPTRSTGVLLRQRRSSGTHLGRVELRDDSETAETNPFPNVFKRNSPANVKTDKDDVGVWVGVETVRVVFILAADIAQGEFDAFSVDFYIGNIGILYGWDAKLVMQDHQARGAGSRYRYEHLQTLPL